MPSFEVKTPGLVEAFGDLRDATSGLRAGIMEVKVANAFAGAADKKRRVVETDLKVRLAQPRLTEIENAVAA